MDLLGRMAQMTHPGTRGALIKMELFLSEYYLKYPNTNHAMIIDLICQILDLLFVLLHVELVLNNNIRSFMIL